MDEIACGIVRFTAGHESRLAAADVDVLRDFLELRGVGNRSQVVLVKPGRTDAQGLRPPRDAVNDLVVDPFVGNHSRAGRTLLALEPERGGANAGDGLVDIRAGVVDDRVLSATAGDDPFQPALPRLNPRA